MIQHTYVWADNDPLVFFIIVVLSAILHFLPSIIAFNRGHTRRIAILVLNILLGWTIIGWIILLIWSLDRQSRWKQLTD